MTSDPSAAAGAAHSPRRGATAASILLVVLGALLVPLSILTVWARNQVLDTDRFVENVAPLADDPAIRTAVSATIAKQINEAAGFQDYAESLLDGRARVLAGPIARGAETLVTDLSDRAVRSEAFPKVWRTANRVGHKNLVAILSGKTVAGVDSTEVADGQVVLALGPLTRQVVNALDRETGLNLADRVPAERLNARFVLVQSDDLASVQKIIRWLDRLSWIVPALAVLCLAGSVLLAADRRRGIRRAATAVVIAAIVTRLGLGAAREFYLDSLPNGPTGGLAAQAVFDIVTRFVVGALRAVFVAGVATLIATWLAGPSTAAVRVRSFVTSGFRTSSAVDGGASVPGPVALWFVDHHGAFQRATLAITGALLIVWNDPTVKVLVVVSFLAFVLIGVAQMLGDTEPTDAAEPTQ